MADPKRIYTSIRDPLPLRLQSDLDLRPSTLVERVVIFASDKLQASVSNDGGMGSAKGAREVLLQSQVRQTENRMRETAQIKKLPRHISENKTEPEMD